MDGFPVSGPSGPGISRPLSARGDVHAPAPFLGLFSVPVLATQRGDTPGLCVAISPLGTSSETPTLRLSSLSVSYIPRKPLPRRPLPSAFIATSGPWCLSRTLSGSLCFSEALALASLALLLSLDPGISHRNEASWP